MTKQIHYSRYADTKGVRDHERLYPATIDLEETAKVLNIHKRVLLELCRLRRIKFLGSHHKGSWKRFAYAYILELCDDVEWLSMAREVAYQFWHRKYLAKVAKKKKAASLCTS